MYFRIYIFLFFSLVCYATDSAIVLDDEEYYKYEDSNIELIYSKENLEFAKHTAKLEPSLHKDYEEFFGWKLDEKLYVGLISNKNQIANGFSTQFPHNMQINYIGGTQLVDYFSSTSWLDTLLYHETAHNYQLNMKSNYISQLLHSVFKNGTIFLSTSLIVPNITENPFMLEGNAVLNESWHGNGGRLYSGRFKAETILQAKAGNIKASDVYNSKSEFPYGNIVYIQGGFYNLYLAKHYGIKNLNSYFKYHSEDFYWPQFTNYSMKKAVGIDFEESLKSFSDEYAKIPLVKAKGKHILSSQFFYPLNSDKNEIFFIINQKGYQTPELVLIDKNSLKIKKIKKSWLGGKVIKKESKYLTQSSAKISTSKIAQGLFDSEAYIENGTDSKMVQGYLSDGRVVYFDVLSSFSEPQLYVGNKFFAKVNSSVFIDKDDNLYYFVQNGKTRTLYKNKTPLYSYKGFYGIVSDVDSKKRIYFIANSKFGSTLYRYNDSKVFRVSDADNIVEAKLVNEKEVFLACISDKDYYYVKNRLINKESKVFETKLFFEDKDYYTNKHIVDEIDLNLKKHYDSLFEMRYSGADFDAGVDVDGDIIGSLNIKFVDPLIQKSTNLFYLRDESKNSIVGIGYSDKKNLFNYNLNIYRNLNNQYKSSDYRENGFILNGNYPFLEEGYYYGGFDVSYFQDYGTKTREPLSFSMKLYNAQSFGNSSYLNYFNFMQPYVVYDRKDRIFGFKYSFRSHIIDEFYIGFDAKYSYIKSKLESKKSNKDTRGVKVTDSSEIDTDISTITMPTIILPIYFKEAGYGEVSLIKVLNYSKYFFTFPYSLKKESIYLKYKNYRLKSLPISSGKNLLFKIDELKAGITLHSIFFNSMEIPLSFEYIYNKGDIDLLKDRYNFRFILGSEF